MTEPAASVPMTSPTSDSPNPQRRRPTRLLTAVMIVVLGFGGGVAGFVVADQWFGEDEASESTGATFQVTNDTKPTRTAKSSGDELTPAEVYRRVSPAVVHVEAHIVRTSTGFFGIPQEQENTGTGSGFVIDSDGHIVTNAHVIDGARDMTVSFGANGTPVPAKLIGEDRSSDIAVIKVDPGADELKGLKVTPVLFGDSTKLRVGDPVIAIGNPFSLDRTLTTGVVSALQREIPSLNDFHIRDVIQTDAAVNPGNSGGPLLNAAGHVIGVNSQIQSRTGSFAGIAFAVPSSRVQTVVDQLIKTGKVTYAWLGVAGGELTPDLAKQMDLDLDHGVVVGTVTEGSPADKAGIEGGRRVANLDGSNAREVGGDVILEFDGKKLSTMRELAGLVDGKKPGDKVKLVFLHDGKKKTVTITLGSRDSVDKTRESANQ